MEGNIENIVMIVIKHLQINQVVKLATVVEGDPKAPFSVATVI